jgi:toxin ParE1/3/4
MRSIADFTLEQWGDRKAAAYIDAIKERYEWLATNPMLGRSRDEVRHGLRSFPQGSHMIFYRAIEDGIEIAGIPHAASDFGTYFENP